MSAGGSDPIRQTNDQLRQALLNLAGNPVAQRELQQYIESGWSSPVTNNAVMQIIIQAKTRNGLPGTISQNSPDNSGPARSSYNAGPQETLGAGQAAGLDPRTLQSLFGTVGGDVPPPVQQVRADPNAIPTPATPTGPSTTPVTTPTPTVTPTPATAIPVNDPDNPYNPNTNANATPLPTTAGNPQTVTPGVPRTGGGNGAPIDIDEDSLAGLTRYINAQQADPQALDDLMVQTLQEMGLDPFSGSETVQTIAKTMAPYLQLVMTYSGLGDPAAAGDQGRAYQERLRGMIGSAGTFGQLRGFGQEIAGKIAPLAADMPVDEQQALMNDLLGMTTAGANRFESAANRRRMEQDQYRFRTESIARPQQVDDYFNWLYGDESRKKHPAYAGIGTLMGR